MAERVECTDLIAYDSEGNEVLRFHPNSSWLRIGPASPPPVLGLPGAPSEAPGWGAISIRDQEGTPGIVLNGASVLIGHHSKYGTLVILDNEDGEAFRMDGNHAFLTIGTAGNGGDITVKDRNDNSAFHIAGDTAEQTIGNESIGGVIKVLDGRGVLHGRNGEAFRMDGNNAYLTIGADGNGGTISVRDSDGRDVFLMDGNHAFLTIGADGNEGDIEVRDGSGRSVFLMDGNHAFLTIGADGNGGTIIVRDGEGNERIRLDGETGDIRLRGADCAEEFDVADGEIVETGTVLVIDDNGTLRPCARAYDRCVAGVVSGASGLTPGIVLGNDPARNGRLPIALNGKVYCKVDAQPAPIRVGDLLTTSDVPGHAMKAQDAGLAFGAVIGKALRNQETGQGLIPILVSLQ